MTNFYAATPPHAAARTRRQLLLGLGVLPLAASLSACAQAVASPGSGHMTGTGTSRLTLDARLAERRRSYQVGEVVSLFLRVNQEAQVAILNVDAEGRVTVLRPNRLAPSALMSPGRWQQFPPPGSDFVLQVARPLGRNEIRVLASASRRPLLPPALLRREASGFDHFEGGTTMLERHLQAQMLTEDHRIAEQRLWFRVVA